MMQKQQSNLSQHWVDYVAGLDQRPLSDITLIVIHCTELPDMKTARQYAERMHHRDSQTGNCGHFYIDREGPVTQYVPLNRAAHHVAGQNHHSIGIELVNTGRFPNWYYSDNQTMTEPYPEVQIKSLIKLVRDMKQVLQSITGIAGHEDLDTRMIAAEDDPDIKIPRKMDPGPMFPWGAVLEGVALSRIR